MQRDFTIRKYRKLLETLLRQGFLFMRSDAYNEMRNDQKVYILLRQDVDRLPGNSFDFARIQYELQIKSTFYFRAMPGSCEPRIIEKIAGMGHEIGYHYEDLSFAQAKLKAQGSGLKAQGEELEKMLVEIGIESFKTNLEKMRQIVPVKTICMHGSPLSRWDSRLLWKYYDYHDFGLIGEPYFDIDFDEVLYLTDTGRRWNGESVSMRDKAEGTHLRSSSYGGQGRLKAEGENPYKDWKVKPVKFRVKGKDTFSPSRPLPLSPSLYKFHSTSDIIQAANENRLPDKIMMTFHPQRWTDKPIPWVKELVWQNVKNVGKYFLVKLRD